MRISFFYAFLRGGAWRGKKPVYLCPPIDFGHDEKGPVAQLDRASHYGCEGLGFESLQSHNKNKLYTNCGAFFIPPPSQVYLCNELGVKTGIKPAWAENLFLLLDGNKGINA